MAYKLTGIKFSPFKGLDYSTVTSDFGPRKFWNPITKKWVENYHRGIDLTSGDIIVATAQGKVTACRNNIEGYSEKYSSGNYVTLYHGSGVYTLYCHMVKGSVKVKVGDIVKVGQELGLKGSTGWSTGPHLHYGVMVNGSYVDPKPYLLGDKALPQYPMPTPEPEPKPVYKYEIGDKVVISGNLYKTANSKEASGNVKEKITFITRRLEGAKHPYNTTGDLGWMDESSIKKYEEPTPTPTPAPSTELKVGDAVEIIGTGNGSAYGGSSVAYGIGWKRQILKIWEGKSYPYQVGNNKATTGFYKKEALKKI